MLEANAATFLDELDDPTVMSIDTAALSSTTVPLMLTYGTASPALFRAVVDELVTLVPEAHVAALAGAGHIPHVTHPDEWAARIAAFHQRPVSSR